MYEIYHKSIKSNTIEKLSFISSDQHLVGAWIKVTAPSAEDILLICRHTGLPEVEVKAMLDEFERPSIETVQNVTSIVFHMPITTEEGVVETQPLVILVGLHNIVTVCSTECLILLDFLRGIFPTFNTTMKTRFVLLLLQRINFYFDKHIRAIDKAIDNFEVDIFKYSDNRGIHKIFNIKKSLIYFNTAVISNGKVLRKVMLGTFLPLFKEDKELLDDIIIDNDQTLETLAIYSGVVTSSLDAYASVVSNNMNGIIKFLTMVTIVLSTPMVIASIWGMNVPVPGGDEPWAFWFIIIASMLLALIVSFLVLRKK